MNGGGDGFPVGLILFGMIAAFLVLRLRSILGRREGFERPETAVERRAADAQPVDIRTGRPIARVIDGKAEPLAPGVRVLPDPASPAGQALARMRAVDRQFDASRFLDGAESAFRIIVTAFAGGDRDTLRTLLSPDSFTAFDSAITAREQAGETQRTDVKAITSAAVEQAELRGTLASITVRFVSDQVNTTTGRDGAIVSGLDAVTEINDLWTFERDLTNADPTWRLVSARSG